jgi:predicted nucleic acid-binding protein
MARYLCDTNVLSELTRPQPNRGVLDWARSVPGIYLSSITVDEVFYCLSWEPRPKTLRWFEDFLEDFCVVLPADERIARAGGALRGRLRAAGETRTQADMLIAATALVHETTLVTRNLRDFEGCGVMVLDPFE